MALILIIFLVCILRKSYCPPRSRVVPLDNQTIPDIFTLFPHVGNYDGGPLGDGTLPPFEKPPTYDETLTLIRNEIGVPPPAYRGRNGTPYSSNPSTPELAADRRVLIQRPQLMAVGASGQQSDGSSTSLSPPSTSSSSLANSAEQLITAGPSGECTRRLVVPSGGQSQAVGGIDNPAFC